MTDHRDSPSPSTRTETCDVCIVGAGLAGMNALFVASRYLDRNQRIILVDRRERVGGMWVDTYPYVRLHQPHAMFTAGNIGWTLDADPAYLAHKGEVLDHFTYCLDVIKQRVRVDEFYGHVLETHEEAGGTVQINCRSTDGRPLTVKAKRLIKAYGFGVTPNEPLSLSSRQVRSVSPDYCDMRTGEIQASDAPVWIIGGGKTGMDTAHALISACPGREINLVAGSGTFFLSRDRCLPKGIRRWWAGTPVSIIAMETSRRFDGHNESAVGDWFRTKYGTQLTPQTGNFMLGILSEAENATIAAGLDTVTMDHLVDVTDAEPGPQLVFRRGSPKTIPAGSWIVNCTGYLLRGEPTYEPFVSGGGSVLSIHPRSATLHLTSYIAYFMTHLMFLDKLAEVPLYELDALELRRKSPEVLPCALFSLVSLNMGLIADSVPGKVFTDCGIDFDRWYPLPRQLMAYTRFRLTRHRDRAHVRRNLDTVRERFDVRCGPLGSQPAQSAKATAG
jgi:hypothetical protein